MNSYQFIIFITFIVLILTLVGKKTLSYIDDFLMDLKTSFPKETVEKFDVNVDLTMPDEDPDPNNGPNQFPEVKISITDPLPGDDMKYLENEKIYINPFYPKVIDEKPKQNYPSPDDMSSNERTAFKYGYPNQLTMQDYVNWLYLYRDSPTLLNLEHNINYQKLIKNVPIQYEEGKVPPPSKRLTPLKAEDYFHSMYTQNPTNIDPLFTQTINQDVRVASNIGTSGILAANYNDYPDFKQNFDVMGTSQYVYNNELAEKTDPYFLQKYLQSPMLIKEPKLVDK